MNSTMMMMTTTTMMMILLRNHTPRLHRCLLLQTFRKGRRSLTPQIYVTTLTKFIASRDKSDSESSTKKKQLIVFFEDIVQTMATFPEVDLAETKREIFNLVNKKEIELLVQKQS